jgi:small subunit ribosomal protein S33
MSAVAPSRLAALRQLQCAIFQTAYNPKSLRTGAKYLRARLVGPSMVKYYPPNWGVSDFRKTRRGADLLVDEDLEWRVQSIEDRKARGKGTPTKAKNKGTLPHPLPPASGSFALQARVVVRTAGDEVVLPCPHVSENLTFALAACRLRHSRSEVFLILRIIPLENPSRPANVDSSRTSTYTWSNPLLYTYRLNTSANRCEHTYS